MAIEEGLAHDRARELRNDGLVLDRHEAALCASGGLNAGTPFEMASTPVSAVQPDEKAQEQEEGQRLRRGRDGVADRMRRDPDVQPGGGESK